MPAPDKTKEGNNSHNKQTFDFNSFRFFLLTKQNTNTQHLSSSP